MDVSTPLGKIVISLIILAAVAAVDALPTPLLEPVDEYVTFILTEDFNFSPWVASAQEAYYGLWDNWDWSRIRTVDEGP